MTVQHRVSVGVLVQGDRVLMCHRRADLSWYPDVWDFPGGHLEDDETAVSALRREAWEELGIETGEPYLVLDRWIADDEDITFVLVRNWKGRPRTARPRNTTTCAGSPFQSRWSVACLILAIRTSSVAFCSGNDGALDSRG